MLSYVHYSVIQFTFEYKSHLTFNELLSIILAGVGRSVLVCQEDTSSRKYRQTYEHFTLFIKVKMRGSSVALQAA